MKCTATSKRTHEPCGGNAIPGTTLCHWHGGRTPTGIALPQFKHGRYSRVLPARLLDRYHAAERDPARLALDAEIALLDARLADVLARVDTGESGALWTDLSQAYADLQAAGKDPARFAAALNLLGRLIGQGQADTAAWAEVGELVQARRRLVESERKHLIEQQQMIAVDAALALMAALLASVKEHVTDVTALSAIQRRFLELTTRPDGGVLDGERVG